MHLHSTIVLISAVLMSAVVNRSFAQDSDWNSALQQFAEDPALRGASVGFAAMEVGSQTLEAGMNPELLLVPASSQKVITCASALELLGPTHRFTTTLGYRGVIESGVLKGDVFIEGGGDPALGAAPFAANYKGFLERWGQAIQALGIERIEGTILTDASRFDDEILAGSTAVADAGNYYGAGAHALSYKGNQYTLTFSSSDKDGGLTRIVSMEPSPSYLKIKNEVRASKIDADNAYIYAVPGEYYQVVRGTIPKGKDAFTIKGAIPSPGLLLAEELEEWLEEAGITLKENPTSSDRIRDLRRLNGELTEIASVESPALAEIIPYVLKKSDNSFSDVLLKNLGVHVYGEGSFEKGALAILDFWEGKLSNADGLTMVDGSGLSRLNAMTATHLAEVCAVMSPDARKVMQQGLKPLGQNQRVQAKSGTLTRVKSYTGYFATSGGGEYAFSIVVNNYRGSSAELRRRIGRLMDALVRS